MKHQTTEQAASKSLLAGGLMFALVGLLLDVRGVNPSQPPDNPCQGEVRSTVAISRQQVAQLLTIPERDAKTRVEAVLQQPYCQLPSLELRAGVTADRVAYPLAFDPDMWLVILYENEEYAGYEFHQQS